MNPNHTSCPRNDRGIALILTLVFLALITITVLAFFSSVTTELASSKSYASGASAKELSDSAVQAVIGTVKEATSAGSTVAWTSQPGLLRTYDDTGSALQVFKLYSSDTMVEAAFDPTHDVDVDWKTKPGLFTDLNMPISRATGGVASLSYPIADAAAADPATGVEGFSLTNAPGYDNSKAAAPDNNPAPMPVKWIYMLKDGTMTAPDKYDAATGIASFTTGAIPTGTNPIVGRMAYWTDDETAKVNINTASEGSFADVPVCNTQPVGGAYDSSGARNSYVADPEKKIYEFDLAEFQGALKEYQRYPGHPATTCLSTVFQKSLTAMNPSISRKDLIKQLTDVTPRVTVNDATGIDNSSWGGTRRAGPANSGSSLKNSTETFYSGFKLIPDSDRLYATPDELMFAPQPAGATKRPEQPLALAGDARSVVEKARFFITAQSRAPELNLFNKPRVAIWPLQVSTARRTYFDKLIAFCASMGVRSGSSVLTPYFFTREDATNGTKDWSVRNQAIYRYLQTITSTNAPGFGKNFSAKYTSAERDQILTEIFDYIRCTNLIDYSDPNVMNAAYTPTGYLYKPGTNVMEPPTQNTTVTSRGQVVPIAPPPGTPGAGTRGIGRIATISELGLVAIRTGPRKDTLPYGTASGSPIQDDTKTELQIVLLPQLFCPMAGFSALANNIRIRFTKISVKINGIDAFISNPSQSGLFSTGRISNSKGVDRKLGGVIGYKALMENNCGDGSPNKSNAGAPVTSLPAYANITIPSASIKSNGLGTNMTIAEAVAANKTMTVEGSIDVQIEAPANANPAIAGPVIQTMHFDFPVTTVPIPNRVYAFPSPYGTGTEPNIVSTKNPAAPVRGERIANTDFRGYNYIDSNIFLTSRRQGCASFDVVRSVVPVGKTALTGAANIQGDIRLIAAMLDVSKDTFLPPLPIAGQAIRPYDDKSNAGVHSMRWGESAASSANFYTSGGYGPEAFQSTNSNGAAFGCLLAGYPIKYAINGNSGSYTGNYLTSIPFGSRWDTSPPVPEGIIGVKNSLGEAGDWDNGPGLIFDGALCNKADEGGERHRHHTNSYDGINFGANNLETANAAYIGAYKSEDDGGQTQYAAFFSPNRMMPSPVMFGSLPTGVARGLPWQTLLFRPAVSYLPGKTSHPGGSNGGAQLPDHLLLDLFWMPVVEPYAISEPMATAGKINMNYQIVPFSHIKRDTGLRALMKSVKITAINPNQTVTQSYNSSAAGKLISDYKRGGNINNRSSGDWGGGVGAKVRYNINMTETLKQFDTERFDKKKAFISASEICEIPLVPEDPSVTSAAGLSTFWANNLLTGDNSLERPYAHMYSRLTTKSNTYTVHVWVEVLRPVVPRGAAAGDASWAQWNESKKDQVVSRYRGSTLIERYIDPMDPALANFDETYNGATETDANGNITKAGSLDPFYKFHVLSTKKFGQ